jgi:hypothetical protein
LLDTRYNALYFLLFFNNNAQLVLECSRVCPQDHHDDASFAASCSRLAMCTPGRVPACGMQECMWNEPACTWNACGMNMECMWNEPSMMLQQGEVSRAHAEGKLSLITREHVLFKFLTNDAGETVAICATYPSNDDLKVLDIADLTPEQLTAQAKAFIDAFSRRFIDVTGFKTITLSANSQEYMLQLYSVMATLYEETLQASQVIFKDDYASVGQESLVDPKMCTFLFWFISHGFDSRREFRNSRA